MSSAPRLAVVLPALLLLTAGADPVEAVACFKSGESMIVRVGETNEGDAYFFGANVDVSGTQNGDLIGFAQTAVIGGEVNGDLIFGAQSMEIAGTVRDTVRYWGNSLTVTGTIEGDLLAFGNQFSIHPRAHITRNAYIFGSSGIIDGRIDGELHFTGGKVLVGGILNGDAHLEAHSIKFAENAKILGDLVYTAPKQLDEETLQRVVQGEVIYEEEVEEPDDEDEGITAWSVGKWIWKIVSSLLVGFVALSLFRRTGPALTGCLDREAVLGGLIGFGTSLIVPAAAGLAILLIISLPLGIVTLLLFVIALYLAKLPVALWLGGRALRALGQAAPPPLLALTVGVILLYLLFLIPFYVGTLVWWLATWLGLGAMVLALRNRGQSGGGEAAADTPAAAGS